MSGKWQGDRTSATEREERRYKCEAFMLDEDLDEIHHRRPLN